MQLRITLLISILSLLVCPSLGSIAWGEETQTNQQQVIVAGYPLQNVEGWSVRVSDALLAEHPDQTKRALELLAEQLRQVKKVLPAEPLAFAMTVPIWLSPEYDGVRPTGEYHPGARWLKDQGRHPELHQCIEFTNTAIFEREIKRMPMMVLHELAHAYHDQVCGYDHQEIQQAYDAVVASGIYNAVLRGNGKTEKAYAMSTVMEYFAETTEAYFGVNDFFPFTNAELQRHDLRMHKLLTKIWKANSESQKHSDP